MATEVENQKKKVDNYLAVIIYFIQCNICSYLKNKSYVSNEPDLVRSLLNLSRINLYSKSVGG